MMWHNKSQNRLQNTIFNSINSGMLFIDVHGNVKAHNYEVINITGYNHPDIIGLSYQEIFSDPGFEDVRNLITKSYEKDKSTLKKELLVTREGAGHNILLVINKYAIGKRKGAGRLINITDISDIVQSKHLIAWGSMAQRLAHEIKTPLSTVMLTAQHLQMECNKYPKTREDTEKLIYSIIEQVDRLRKMTDAFLKFAQIEKPNPESMEVHDFLSECIEEVISKWRPQINIKTNFSDDVKNIFADRQQLRISFENIINNSIHAMGGSGNITITTRLIEVIPKNNNKSTVEIEIADTGRGIPKKYLNKVFQQFFSKYSGGTGIGLAIVKKIVEDHHGSIRIERIEDIGTTVFIALHIYELKVNKK